MLPATRTGAGVESVTSLGYSTVPRCSLIAVSHLENDVGEIGVGDDDVAAAVADAETIPHAAAGLARLAQGDDVDAGLQLRTGHVAEREGERGVVLPDGWRAGGVGRRGEVGAAVAGREGDTG